MPDLYRDFVFGALRASVAAGDTTATLDDVSSFPSNDLLAKADFYVAFDSTLTHPNSFEIVKLTGVNTAVGTITFTPPAAYSHPISTGMKGVLTAGMLLRARAGSYGTVVPAQDDSIYGIGDRFLLTTSNTEYVYTSSGFVPASGSARQTATATTASVAPYGKAMTTIALAKGYRLYQISTSLKARVELYTTAAAQTADLTRAVGVDPTASAGVVLDYLTPAANTAYSLSPLVQGVNLEANPSSNISMTVTNYDTVTGPIAVQLTWVKEE